MYRKTSNVGIISLRRMDNESAPFLKKTTKMILHKCFELYSIA